jgi:peptidylprolyl isomerase domain and WD repeat-containing protein 1
VKHYRAHLSPILSLAVSADGALAATIAADGQLLAAGGYKNDIKGSVKVFDIENFGQFPSPPLFHSPLCLLISMRPSLQQT